MFSDKMRFDKVLNAAIEIVREDYASSFDRLRSKEGSLLDIPAFCLQFGITSTILVSGILYGGAYMLITGNIPAHMNGYIKRKFGASYEI